MTLRGQALMAAAILDVSATDRFRSSTPVKLFNTGAYFAPTGGPNSSNAERTYDVSADGRRFLMLKDVSVRDDTPPAQSITVVQNWVQELKRRVPVN